MSKVSLGQECKELRGTLCGAVMLVALFAFATLAHARITDILYERCLDRGAEEVYTDAQASELEHACSLSSGRTSFGEG